jgi:hypothetical protein
MSQPGRIQCKTHKIKLTLCAVLSMLIILFFNIICEGQEE